ncbi:hypothetical protein FA95DRAFT_1506315, partial [Auriscalpium vulgare]
LLGICLNFCLYGVLAAQVYSYNYNFAEDKKRFKVLVYGIFIIETAQTAMTGADVFYWYAAGFGNVARLQNTYISSLDTPFMGSFISLIVQWFYAYRIWVIKPALLWLSGVVSLVRPHLRDAIAREHPNLNFVTDIYDPGHWRDD